MDENLTAGQTGYVVFGMGPANHPGLFTESFGAFLAFVACSKA
jgi:hypothetical protein